MPGDPQQNGNAAPDLNQIPASMIERIEVLTGGASAVYGADAVAGVINFILNDDFEGVRIDAQYGFYDHDNSSNINSIVEGSGFATPDSSVRDGYSKDITFTLGMNSGDGRGNATVYAGYRELDALLAVGARLQRLHAGFGRRVCRHRIQPPPLGAVQTVTTTR
jgi:outer membrane receptor protein involved in Fe transport